MPDQEGYPTSEELVKVKNYDPLKDDINDFLDFLESIWWMSDWGFKLTGKRVLRLELHTGGWSGNEEIIEELQSTMFFMLWWRKSLRGGHYYFRIRKLGD